MTKSPRDKFDRLSMFDRTSNQFVWTSKNPVTGAPANVRPGIRDADWRDFAPRIGLAYQLDSRTTIRSGYGMFYAPNQLWETQGIRGQWPYAVSENLTGLNSIFPTLPMEIMYPAYTTPTAQSLPAGSFALGRTDRVGYSQQWNLGVQRELARDLLLEVDYIASKGTKLSTFVSQNAPRPGPGVIGSPNIHGRILRCLAPLMRATGRVPAITNRCRSNSKKGFQTGCNSSAPTPGGMRSILLVQARTTVPRSRIQITYGRAVLMERSITGIFSRRATTICCPSAGVSASWGARAVWSIKWLEVGS